MQSPCVSQIPVKTPSETQQDLIRELVDHILAAGGEGPQVSAWEQELNALIYQVYGLTEDEVALIEETLTP